MKIEELCLERFYRGIYSDGNEEKIANETLVRTAESHCNLRHIEIYELDRT